jgi:hypothetical protein
MRRMHEQEAAHAEQSTQAGVMPPGAGGTNAPARAHNASEQLHGHQQSDSNTSSENFIGIDEERLSELLAEAAALDEDSL